MFAAEMCSAFPPLNSEQVLVTKAGRREREREREEEREGEIRCHYGY